MFVVSVYYVFCAFVQFIAFFDSEHDDTLYLVAQAFMHRNVVCASLDKIILILDFHINLGLVIIN